jgi:lipopolysaccharide export system protein LptA
MIASGEVKSSYMNKSGRKDTLPLFESDKILFIASDRLSVRQKNDVLYSGNVRAWQEENSISARELAIDLGKKRVEARGDVISRFQNVASLKSSDTEENPEKQSSLQKAEVHSDSLIYSSEENRALYSGHVVVKMEDREISCGELQIQLSREGKAKKMLAQNDVILKTSGYSSTGDKLEYDMSERHAVMHGNAEPAKVCTFLDFSYVRR